MKFKATHIINSKEYMAVGDDRLITGEFWEYGEDLVVLFSPEDWVAGTDCTFYWDPDRFSERLLSGGSTTPTDIHIESIELVN